MFVRYRFPCKHRLLSNHQIRELATSDHIWYLNDIGVEKANDKKYTHRPHSNNYYTLTKIL